MVGNRMRNETGPTAADEQDGYVLTFDRFDPQNYGGFVWEHFSRASDGGGMARNEWAQGSAFKSLDGVFNLESLKLGGELESLTIRVFGFLDGQAVYMQPVRVTTDALLDVQLGWHGIDAVYFDVESAGTQYPGALFFRMDDVFISA